MDKNSNNSSQPIDPSKMDKQMTIEVDNTALNELLATYKKDSTGENLSALINTLINCRVLIPAQPNPTGRPMPLTLKTPEGKVFQPVFTDKNQLNVPNMPKAPVIMNMPYADIDVIASRQPIIEGIVINPSTDNIAFRKELVNKIADTIVNAKKAQAEQPKKVQMSETDYNLMLRRKFEFETLPRTVFTQGNAFIDRVISEGGIVVDELLRTLYNDQSIYPYMAEDFSVFPMRISDTLQLTCIDLPEKYLGIATCPRVYLASNPEENTCEYFAIIKNQPEDELIKINPNGKPETIGPAPVEGTEFYTIMEYLKAK